MINKANRAARSLPSPTLKSGDCKEYLLYLAYVYMCTQSVACKECLWYMYVCRHAWCLSFCEGLKPWLDLTMPKQMFWRLNPCLAASFLQEVVRPLGIARHFSASLLHQQHFLMPMHTAQQQTRSSFLHHQCIINSEPKAANDLKQFQAWLNIQTNHTHIVDKQ